MWPISLIVAACHDDSEDYNDIYSGFIEYDGQLTEIARSKQDW